MTTPRIRNAPPIVSVKTRVLILWAFLLVFTVGLLALTGWRPYSNWFYPFILLTGIAASLRSLKDGERPWSDVDPDPKSPQHSLAFAAATFLFNLIFVYGTLTLLRPQLWMWPVALLISASNAVNSYRYRRGRKYAVWPSVALLAAFIVLLEVFSRLRG